MFSKKDLRNYIDKKHEETNGMIYSSDKRLVYNNQNQTIEGKKDNGSWVIMRTYCIPPYKEDYGKEIGDYYQVVRENLEMIFEELQEMRELANADLVRKEVSDACFIADCVLTFLSAQIDRAISGADDGWSDIHSMEEIFKAAAEEGGEKTIEVSTGQKDADRDWFQSFLEDLQDFLELPGDYFAVDRPAWDATMERVNQKLIKDEKMSKDTVGKVSEIISKQFGAVENLYSYYEEKIGNEKYGFFAVHEIDGPDISFGIRVLIDDFPQYIMPKAFDKVNQLVFGSKTKIIGKAYQAKATCQRIVETIEKYNTDVLDTI